MWKNKKPVYFLSTQSNPVGVKEGKTKAVLSAEKSCHYKEHYHTALEVIEGHFAQSIKSDRYSAGVVIASLFKFS